MQNDERINRSTAFHSQIASINRSSHLLGTAAAASFNAVPAAAADATPTVPSYGQPTDIICISISLSLSLSLAHYCRNTGARVRFRRSAAN